MRSSNHYSCKKGRVSAKERPVGHDTPTNTRISRGPDHLIATHGDTAMDDLYAINAAKSEFRDCFNLSDVSRLLAIADPDLVHFSDGQPWKFGMSVLGAFTTRLQHLR